MCVLVKLSMLMFVGRYIGQFVILFVSCFGLFAFLLETQITKGEGR